VENKDNKKVTEFINRLFESREQAHVYHLQSEEYAKHMALDTYYKDVVELFDILIETYQGQYGLIGDYTLIRENDIDKSDVIKYFDSLAIYLNTNRYISFNEKDTHLQSLIDDIIILTYQTIYKLKYLK